jgi:hypothetical protein
MSSYEIRVAGRIGPVVESILPGFATLAIHHRTTVISGTTVDADGLFAVLSLLGSHGLTPIDTLITPSDSEPRDTEALTGLADD